MWAYFQVDTFNINSNIPTISNILNNSNTILINIIISIIASITNPRSP